MRTRSLLPTLGVALCLGAAAWPAAAQSPTTSPTTSPTAAATTLAHWGARPIGKYVLELALPDRVMEAELTIGADAAGHLTALFWPVGDHDGHEMSVTVKDTDLLLHADTPRGPADFVLQRQNERIVGRWTLGEEHGTLQGKASS
jgi:hypothetical protein